MTIFEVDEKNRICLGELADNITHYVRVFQSASACSDISALHDQRIILEPYKTKVMVNLLLRTPSS
jgi:hypothetical protein